MDTPDVIILHQPPRPDDGPLTGMLAEARTQLARHHENLFRRAGAHEVGVLEARVEDGQSFGERLRRVVVDRRLERIVVLGSGSVALLRLADARRLLAVAGGPPGRALTNNRYSSDVCAVSGAAALRHLPALSGDNALPRWLAQQAGFLVDELPGRERLALDLDTPLDVALLALAPRLPPALRKLSVTTGIRVPRLEEIRAVVADPRAELLVFGRSGAMVQRWLERNTSCRVRFLAEERGLRSSSPLALPERARQRPPRATLGRLLDARGPGALAETVAEFADGALLDSRVLLADHLGRAESAWPPSEDRFASDLLRPGLISHPWLRELTESAARAPIPVLLGGHTLVGPAVRLLFPLAPRSAQAPKSPALE